MRIVKPYRFLFLSIVLIYFCGCSQPLMTLKALGDEQKAQEHFVTTQAKKFDLLRQDVEARKLALDSSQKMITRRYGEPVLVITVPKDRQVPAEVAQTWLYRYPTKYFDVSKIYLDFDVEENLVAIRFEEADIESTQ